MIAYQDVTSQNSTTRQRRIIIDSLNGIQYTLYVNCAPGSEYGYRFLPRQMGTQKRVMVYKGEYEIAEYIYRPVYDTVALLQMFPKMERKEYFDTSLNYNKIINLTKIDSLLMDRFIQQQDSSCEAKQLNLIRGFVLVDEDHQSSKYKREKINYKVK